MVKKVHLKLIEVHNEWEERSQRGGIHKDTTHLNACTYKLVTLFYTFFVVNTQWLGLASFSVTYNHSNFEQTTSSKHNHV